MSLPLENNPNYAQYAHPERLVSTDWLAANLGAKNLVVLESNEDILLYSTGHIPGALKIDWFTELNDEVTRDYVEGEAFAQLMAAKGISRDSTVVIYGDKSNWWAAYALWVFTLFGHEDVRLLDGGRDKWIAEGRETSTEKPAVTATQYPVIERDDSVIRAYLPQVLEHLGNPLIDVRSLRNTPANVPTCQITPKRVRCAAGIFRPPPRCRGVKLPLPMAHLSHAPN